MLIKEWHLEKSCYFKDRANQGLVNQGLTVLYSKIIAILNLGKRDTVIIPEKLVSFKSKFYMPANGN